MQNIRLATLAKIIIPLFMLCTVVIFISFTTYYSAVEEEQEVLSSVIEEIDGVLELQAVIAFHSIQAQTSSLLILLMWVIGISIVIALSALTIIMYKLMPIRNLINIAAELADEDAEENNIIVPNDELGDLTKELAHKIKSVDINMKTFEKRDRVLDALKNMAVIFLSHQNESFDERMEEGLKPIVAVAEIDSVVISFIFENVNTLRVEHAHRWLRGKMTHRDEKLILPKASVAYRWIDLLKEDKCVNVDVSELPEDEVGVLNWVGIKSILIVPIFYKGSLYGVVSFEDHTHCRYFDDDYVELMRSVAYLCAGACVSEAMEREVSDANELNREILNTAPISINIIDENMRVIDCNDSTLSLFGCDDKQYYLDNFFRLTPEYQSDGAKSDEKAMAMIRQALNGETVIFEYTHLTYDGELFPVEVTLIPVKHNEQYIVFGYQYDLRNIKKMEKAATEAEELTRAVTEASPFAYILFGKNLVPVDCNDAAQKLLACHDKQYLLDNYWDKFSPEFQPDGSKSVEKAPAIRGRMLTEKQHVYEWVHVSLEGEIIPTENTLTLVTYKNENFVISFKYDMRRIKKLTDSVFEQSELLKEALEKAKAGSRAKSDFLSNMSHEIRTPMNAIIGMTNIAKSSHSIERKDYALGKIEDASSHLLGIINDILDMSKIEANKLELHPVVFVFEEMLKKVINIINFRVVEKRQKISVFIDENIPRTLLCDDQRLAQIITNLLSNAVKFTPENGTIKLDTRLLKSEGGFHKIQFSVSDTGVGIDKEHLAKLFSPFEQAESSTTRKYGGTGLGLTISKRIVEMMGGDISVSSTPGEGSTFTFTINAEKSDKETENTLLAACVTGVDEMRVLIVDDDEDIREYFVDIAMRFNIACDTAANGDEALGLIESGKTYDLCFVDWIMPYMNGIELTRRIKAIDRNKSIVIMISSVEWQEIADEAGGAGIEKFLSKPIFPSAFIECVKQYLGVDLLGEEKNCNSVRIDRFSGYRVLLVEDVEINREIVVAMLEPTLIEIDCAENGKEAVRIFSESPQKYNIIFMDLQMPEMDGFEATRSIRALDHNKAKTIPIVAMTANVFKEDVENCLAAGMNDHIGKPLDFDEVLLILRRNLFKQSPQHT